MILITCVIKDADKLYLQLFIGEVLIAKNLWEVGKMLVWSSKMLLNVGGRQKVSKSSIKDSKKW